MTLVGLNTFMFRFVLVMATITVCRAAVIIPTGGECPASWITLDEKCFIVVTEFSTSWNEARRYCQGAAPGGDLAQPDVIRSLAFELSKRTNRFSHTDYWLGGTDADNEGQWRWANGGTILRLDENWHPGSPNGGRGSNCLRMRPASAVLSLIDTPCDDDWTFVCERPKNITKPDPIQVWSPEVNACMKGWSLGFRGTFNCFSLDEGKRRCERWQDFKCGSVVYTPEDSNCQLHESNSLNNINGYKQPCPDKGRHIYSEIQGVGSN